MRPCPACDCHVLSSDPHCPHCGASLTVPSMRGRVGATALSAGLALMACSTDTDPEDTVATTVSGTGSESGGEESSTETTIDSLTEGDESFTDSDDSITDSDDSFTDGETEAAYGVPSLPCSDVANTPVFEGANPITIDPFWTDTGQSCGGLGTANVFYFTAESAGDYEISLDEADFDAVLSAHEIFCTFFDEYGCALPPEESLTVPVAAGQTVYIAIDGREMSVDGTGTLNITKQ